MGIRGIFIAGSIFLTCRGKQTVRDFSSFPRNDYTYHLFPGYSVIDFSLLDPHWGDIDDWRNLIDIIHAKGMVVMMDFTVGTMADYIGFVGCVLLFA